MLVVGLTGDVGAGKSSAARIWKGLGAMVIDADRVAKDLWEDPEIRTRAVGRWGRGILDSSGRLLPSQVAGIVFENRDEYRWLCDLLHPGTRAEMERRAESAGGWIIAEIPLLFENGVPWWVDMTVYVTAPLERRIDRNAHRDWDEAEIRRRESWFMPTEEKVTLADRVIENAGSLDDLRKTLTAEAETMKALASISAFSACFGDPEEGRTFATTLAQEGIAAGLTFRESSPLEGTAQALEVTGYCREQAFPEIRKSLPATGHFPKLTPLRHMDPASLMMLHKALSP